VQLGNCQGVTEEDLDMPAGAAALEAGGGASTKENLPDEMHTRAWAHIAFFRIVQKFLARCGYTDFGLRDLVKPEKGRFLRQLCAMLAFVKFQDALLGQFYELCQTVGLSRRDALGLAFLLRIYPFLTLRPVLS
jgi:Nuf2 family